MRATSLAGSVVPDGEAVRFRVLDAARPEERAAWLDLWGRWPAREVMAHPEYAALFARECDRVVAVACETGGGGVIFPLLLRPLAAEPWAGPGEETWDAITPYGYGGPFAWGERRDDAGFWRTFDEWCRDSRVVSTFTRLSLFADQIPWLPARVEARGPNVVVPLAAGRDALVEGYDRDVRRALRVASREGVRVEIDREGARLADFHEIYAHTMARRDADVWYHFPRSFFERIVARLRGQFALVHALAGGQVLSSELVLVSERHVYAFLGGTRSDAFRLFPNESVRHATAEWAIGEGKAGYVLGGGREPEDGIFRHKRIFAPGGVVPFRTACFMHDEAAYHALVRRRDAAALAAGRPWAPRAGFFPMYRA